MSLLILYHERGHPSRIIRRMRKRAAMPFKIFLVMRRCSERVGPVVILVVADLAALAKHICEVVPLFTLGDHVTTEGRILHCSDFPVVTELLKNLCFGVMAHVVCVTVYIIGTGSTGMRPRLCHYVNCHKQASSKRSRAIHSQCSRKASSDMMDAMPDFCMFAISSSKKDNSMSS